MIVMINGAFGSGKTTAATKLVQIVPNSMLFNPEEIGYMLRKIIPEEIRHDNEKTDDFQDIELWRKLTVSTVKEVKKKYGKNLIIPMTIYKDHNFEYIKNGLKEIDKDLYHFCLIAREDIIHKRLYERGDKAGGWTFLQTSKCVATLSDKRYEEHIITDSLNQDEVVNRIITRISKDYEGFTKKSTDFT
ncbi:adenylate kinase family enzyme [Fontibacillus solani]|uniref:Adenylate kinase family enzyme n=1 Tax=Fontibacillus solani TaxID=1572857 RepID=A0A7W3SU55_9BACL|nr:AAA family ATPase [Fontibacillus solani]MBA9086033.1 adenylate kinase family enzyme [Fontibacillus solani]